MKYEARMSPFGVWFLFDPNEQVMGMMTSELDAKAAADALNTTMGNNAKQSAF
jgi:hypothetical protein